MKRKEPASSLSENEEIVFLRQLVGMLAARSDDKIDFTMGEFESALDSRFVVEEVPGGFRLHKLPDFVQLGREEPVPGVMSGKDGTVYVKPKNDPNQTITFGDKTEWSIARTTPITTTTTTTTPLFDSTGVTFKPVFDTNGKVLTGIDLAVEP